VVWAFQEELITRSLRGLAVKRGHGVPIAKLNKLKIEDIIYVLYYLF
jgi:hypothetical protein